ncbi:MAG TPA: OmpA family protein [Kofleriaceae bacterium]
MSRHGLVALCLVASCGPGPAPSAPIVPVAIVADTDADRDRLPDSRDACPRQAEDEDGFADADGCPDDDNDGDTVLDRDDMCVIDAEDRDSFEDTDGCPDPDNDGDRIADANDQCPNEPETYNATDDEDGCPDTRPAAFHIHPPVQPPRITFAPGLAALDDDARMIINVVRDTMRKNPWVRLRIVGHAERRERNGARLAKTRAQAVENELVRLRIGRERIVVETGTASHRHLTLDFFSPP